MYYLRTKAATDAIKFTVEKKYTEQPSGEAQAAEVLAAATSAAAAAVTVGETQQQATMNFEVQSPYSGQSAEEIAKQQAAIACSLDNPDACEMCSG
jgi:ribonucleoside-diphosphate reductase alpha chain